MKFKSVFGQFLLWIFVLSLNLSLTQIITAQENPNRLGQNGWCCRDGKVYKSTEEKCAEEGGFFFFEKKQAQKYCKKNFKENVKKKLPKKKALIQEEQGWCCANGEVFPVSLEECEEQGGLFFQTEEEAIDHCRPEEFPPEEEDGWCCRNGEVFPFSMEDCERENGIFFHTEEEAWEHCDREFNPEEEHGWCCHEGEVHPIPVEECERIGGIYFPTEEEAWEHCDREFRHEEETDWCCIDGQVVPISINECEANGGIFFQTEEEAIDHCRPEEFPPEEEDGWCCHEGEVYPIPIEDCERIGGIHFPTEEEAVNHCMQEDFRPVEDGWCCIDDKVSRMEKSNCIDNGGYFFLKRLEAKEYCAYLKQQGTTPSEETMDTDKTPEKIFQYKPTTKKVEYLVLEDATIDEAFPDIAMGKEPTLKVSWSAKVGNLTQRTLIKFPDMDLPDDALITNAVLEVTGVNVSGDDVASVSSTWFEDDVTWNSQPSYNRPLIQNIESSGTTWNVAPIVSGWHSKTYTNHGFVITEEAGTVTKSIYKSKEGGSPAKLIIEYIIDDCDCDPLPPDNIGPLEFLVDITLQPDEISIAPMMVNGEEIDRPVAVFQYENLSPLKFIEDEVIFKSHQPGDVDEFISKYGGRILRYPGLPDPPAGLDLPVRDIDEGSSYLIKVDPALMDLNTINNDAAALGINGRHAFSSDNARNLFAIIFREQSEDNSVSINQVGEFTQHFPKTSFTEQTNGPLFEDPMNNTFNFPEISDATQQNTGVNRAWQYMSFSTRQNDVWAAVIDGGFPVNDKGKPIRDKSNNTYLDLPSKYAQYDFNDDDYIAAGDNLAKCTGGTDCPTHGTGTSAAVSAVQDNSYGIAGVGSPVAKPMLFKVGTTLDQAERAIRTAVKWGAKVVNMSFIFDCDYWCREFGWYSGYDDFKDALSLADANGLFLAAAAGNYDQDLHKHHYIPATLKWTTLCVGALADNSRAKADYSNYGTWSATSYGTGGVNIWAPGTVRVGPDKYHTSNNDVSGTSIASPFVAGAAALVWGVKPSLTNHQIRSLFHSTLNAPLNTTVQPGSINVLRAVQNAGKPLDDKYGSHSYPDKAVWLTDKGLTDLTITPGEVDYFYYQADKILEYVEITVTYVAELGELIIGSPDPTASKTKSSDSQTTTRTIRSKKMLCNGDDFYFYIKGANTAVGNAYNLSVSTTAETVFKQDKNEPNDLSGMATKIQVLKPNVMDSITGLCPSCGSGLTLHHKSDVDYYTFTVKASDFSKENPDLKVSLCANVSLTMKVYIDGILNSTQNGASIVYKEEQCKGGKYLLEITGKTVNSYNIRARICNLFREEQAPKWEAWLKQATMPQPPKLIPGLDTIIRDLPIMVKQYDWNETGLYKIESDYVRDLDNEYLRENISMDGSRSIYIIGAAQAQTLDIDLKVHCAESSRQDDIAKGVFAGVWNAQGDNLWQSGALTEDTSASIELNADQTYFLIINGTEGTHSNLGIDIE